MLLLQCFSRVPKVLGTPHSGRGQKKLLLNSSGNFCRCCLQYVESYRICRSFCALSEAMWYGWATMKWAPFRGGAQSFRSEIKSRLTPPSVCYLTSFVPSTSASWDDCIPYANIRKSRRVWVTHAVVLGKHTYFTLEGGSFISYY